MNKVADLKLVYTEPEEEGGVDMCKAMEDYTKKTKILGEIEFMKRHNIFTEEMIKEIMEVYKVPREYVEELLEPVAI